MIAKAEVKYIQSLAHKKFREEEGLFVVEGVKMVEALMEEKPAVIKKIFAIEAWIRQHASSLSPAIDVQVLEDFELNKISSLQTPNEVLALVQIPQPTISGGAEGIIAFRSGLQVSSTIFEGLGSLRLAKACARA
jgi:TrmH family RNA methyltransferase